jgi:hypothetical protein
MVAYARCRKMAPASGGGKGRRKGPGKGEKGAEMGKKMFFRGNELSYVLQTKDLAILRGQKRTRFE